MVVIDMKVCLSLVLFCWEYGWLTNRNPHFLTSGCWVSEHWRSESEETYLEMSPCTQPKNSTAWLWGECWGKYQLTVMRPHIAYAHNDTCATLLQRFGTIRAQGWQRTTRDDTLCDHLRCLIPSYNTLQCSLSLLRPFLTFSDAFRPFATFLDFALFNTPPNCVAFSGTFHQTLFTWLVHHSFGFSAIISVWSALRFADISRFSLLL